MTLDQLSPNKILRGPLFAEPVQVIITTPMATAVKLVGRAWKASWATITLASCLRNGRTGPPQY